MRDKHWCSNIRNMNFTRKIVHVHAMKAHRGEQRYRSIHSYPRLLIEMSCRVDAPATLSVRAGTE